MMDSPFREPSQDIVVKKEMEDTPDLFTRHCDSVLCCSIGSNRRLAVSGGIDDTAFVWDLSTKHVIFECLGHKESVVAASFSGNSTYVATGDLSGYIQVRNTTTGMKVFEFDIDEINWILWHNTSEFVLLAGTTKGDFWMWNVNDPAAVKTFSSYGAATTTANLLPDGMKIIVTYQDGSIRLFDLKTMQTILRHEEPNKTEIISIDLNKKSPLLAVGCIDGSVRIHTMGSLKVIGTMWCKSPEKVASNTTNGSTSSAIATDQNNLEDSFEDEKFTNEGQEDGTNLSALPDNVEPLEIVDEYSSTKADGNSSQDLDIDDDNESDNDIDDENMDEDEESHGSHSVESVLFSPCANLLAASNNSGSIYIYDVSSQATRCETHTSVGITRCAWTESSHYITGCLDGVIRIYDINLILLKQFQTHSDQILDLKYEDQIIITASEDKTCAVTKLQPNK